MPGQEISSWTFDSLVAAFVDLAIAYLLLCASALVYLASKFLGLFGSSLPCRRFSDPDKDVCFKEIVGNFPVKVIYSVHQSVKANYPFANGVKFTHLAKEKRSRARKPEFDGEDPCSMILAKGYEDVVGNERALRDEVDAYFVKLSSQSEKEENLEIKGIQLGVHRSLYSLRHQPKDSSEDQLQSDTHFFQRSPSSVAKTENDDSKDETVHVMFEDEGKSLEDIVKHEVVSYDSQLEERSYDIKPRGRISSGEVEINIASPLDFAFSGSARSVIRMLEQALEEEQAACAALSLELEKERNASATAADEAMAMILRLQGEKASIEMEAKQYRRMVEAKSAFDTEEMNILKEILLRRETEKHFLEKEVEAYRQMLLENEQSEINLLNTKAFQKDGEHLIYPNDDAGRMSHRIDGSLIEVGHLETLNDFVESMITSNRKESCVLTFGKELSIPEFEDDADSLKLEEINQNPADGYAAYEDSEGINVDEENEGNNLDEAFWSDQSISHKNTMIPDQERLEESNKNCMETKGITEYHDNMIDEKHAEDYSSSRVDVHHDVRVIGNDVNTTNELMGSKKHQLEKNVPSSYPTPSDVDHTVGSLRQDHKFDRSRSVSDMAHRLPSFCHPQGKSRISDMRRKSMSAFDFERLKIENEVGWLRGKLRVVQQSREKLKFSLGNRGKDKTHLQLLGDMTNQPRETPQLTSFGRSLRQDSLPPLSSKVKFMSKKRRWRSCALDLSSA